MGPQCHSSSWPRSNRNVFLSENGLETEVGQGGGKVGGGGEMGPRVESGLASSGTRSHFVISPSSGFHPPKTPIRYLNSNNLSSQHTSCLSGLCELSAFPPHALPALPSAQGDEPVSQRRAKDGRNSLAPPVAQRRGAFPPPPVSLWG